MKAPRLPSIFKLTQYNRNRTFSYEPRTFDERKERLEKRRKEIEQEVQKERGNNSSYRVHLSGRISETWHRKETRRQQRNSGARLLLILAALMLILYFVFKKFGFLL